MTAIREGASPLTLINVFTVEPERQKDLVAALEEATERSIRHRPGFVSVNIHASLDGTRVVNYAQWETREHLEDMLADPTSREHIQKISELAASDPQLYEVSTIIER
jgi:quinol monooxygenase YgiN